MRGGVWQSSCGTLRGVVFCSVNAWLGRRKPIEAWFVAFGQLGLVEVGVSRLVGLRYGRRGLLGYGRVWQVMVWQIWLALDRQGNVSWV